MTFRTKILRKKLYHVNQHQNTANFVWQLFSNTTFYFLQCSWLWSISKCSFRIYNMMIKCAFLQTLHSLDHKKERCAEEICSRKNASNFVDTWNIGEWWRKSPHHCHNLCGRVCVDMFVCVFVTMCVSICLKCMGV